MSHPNEAVVAEFLTAVISGDMEAVSSLVAEDIVWHFAGRSSMSGVYRGRDAFADFAEKMGRHMGTEGVEHRIELHDLVGNDDHTMALWTRIARRDGTDYRLNGVGVYHVREGRITEVWVIHEDQYAADEFFA